MYSELMSINDAHPDKEERDETFTKEQKRILLINSTGVLYTE